MTRAAQVVPMPLPLSVCNVTLAFKSLSIKPKVEYRCYLSSSQPPRTLGLVYPIFALFISDTRRFLKVILFWDVLYMNIDFAKLSPS